LIEKGFSSGFSSYMITVAWLGYALGCPFLGFISDYIQKRKPILVTAALFSAFSIASITFCTNIYLISISFFLLGFGASGISIGYALMAEQFKKNFIAIGLGLNNGMITVVSAINAPILGVLLNYHGNPEFTLPDYQFAFSFLVGLVFLSIILVVFFIKESFCKSQATFTILDRN